MTTHDFFEPKLRVRASGLGGSGYRIPTRPGDDGKLVTVPGVTTVLGVLDKGGITQWSVDQTVAYMIANIDMFLNRTEEQGFKLGRFYHSRKVDFDDPEVDPNNYHTGVLNDLAELGTHAHDYTAYDLLGMFPPDPLRVEHAEMATAWDEFRAEHDIEPLAVERTVVGDGFAGTLDGIWKIDGVPTLVDVKTSRAVRGTHIAQLAALHHAEFMMEECDPLDKDAVAYDTKRWGTTYWREVPIPHYEDFQIVQIRPSDIDKDGYETEPFVAMHRVTEAQIDAGWQMFQGALQARWGQKAMKEAMK